MIFSYTDAEFIDKNIVKVIHGVAGRGKSSVINSFMQANNIEYLWTTSTNKLKRDAESRYNCKASTVCSALFENKNGCFYIPKKIQIARLLLLTRYSRRLTRFSRGSKTTWDAITL